MFFPLQHIPSLANHAKREHVTKLGMWTPLACPLSPQPVIRVSLFLRDPAFVPAGNLVKNEVINALSALASLRPEVNVPPQHCRMCHCHQHCCPILLETQQILEGKVQLQQLSRSHLVKLALITKGGENNNTELKRTCKMHDLSIDLWCENRQGAMENIKTI